MDLLTFNLPKRGHSAVEYEDAAAGDVARGRFAVADGASESAFAADWARALVEGFVADERALLGPWQAWLPAAQRRFAASATGGAQSWYSEMKLQMGAQAAFLGLAVGTTGDVAGHWQAVCVGDCCLFQVRDDVLRVGVPVGSVASFGLQPSLVSSLPGALPTPERGECRAAGRWAPGDRLWLMTDGLAPWFLGQHEQGNQPWSHVEGMLAVPDARRVFAEWVEGLRSRGQVRNDDSTLLLVTM